MSGKLTPMQVVLKKRAVLEAQVQDQAREIARLKAELSQAGVGEVKQREQGDCARRERDALRAEVERLKGERDEWCRKATTAQHEWRKAGDLHSDLRRDVERLKPSGPVAEDVKALGALFAAHDAVTSPDPGMMKAADAALPRLVAGAQSAQAKNEAIKALADALKESAAQTMSDGSPCWCRRSAFRQGEEHHVTSCRKRRAALRLVGRL